MGFGSFLSELWDAVTTPDDEVSTWAGHGPTRYHWRCECGGHSRDGGFLIESDATYAAERHQWRQGVGHALPDVYSEDLT